MTETIEATAPPELAPKKRRFTFWRVMGVAWAAAVVAWLVIFAQGAYEDQARAVDHAEQLAAKYTTKPWGADLEARPDVQAFKSTPLLKTQAWAAYVSEIRNPDGRGEDSPTDATLMKSYTDGVWWPGLSDRAEKAARDMKYTPDWYGARALSSAVGMVETSCKENKNLTADERATRWKADRAKDYGNNFQPAAIAVAPAIFQTGVPIFCKA
jgi:hypothetical protein